MKPLNLFFIISFTILLFSCNKKDIVTEINGVGIRVINDTSHDFENLKFVLYNRVPISFASINKGEITDYLERESIGYSFYNVGHDEVYFAYNFTAIVDGVELNSFKGLCGTGLTTKTIEKGKFSIIIRSVDMDKKSFSYTEKKEE